jgi:hypothetical protein
MSKFFVQMLFSVMVGISAAFGFNPHLESQLHDAWQETSTYLHETTNVVFKSTDDLKTNVTTGVSVQAVSKSSAEGREKVNIKVTSNVKTKSSHGDSILGNLLPTFSLSNSASTQTQASAGADASDMDVTVKEKTQSTLKLNLGIGK